MRQAAGYGTGSRPPPEAQARGGRPAVVPARAGKRVRQRFAVDREDRTRVPGGTLRGGRDHGGQRQWPECREVAPRERMGPMPAGFTELFRGWAAGRIQFAEITSG